jgi:hypothetical protein
VRIGGDQLVVLHGDPSLELKRGVGPLPLRLARALPALTPEEISTRFAFTASIIMKVLLSRRGVLDARTPESTGVDEIVAFTAAGMRARSPVKTAARQQRRTAAR